MKKAKLFLTGLFVLVLTAPSWAGWDIVDDFEGETLGTIHGKTAANGQVWNIQEDTQPYMEVVAGDTGQMLELLPSIPTYGLGYLNLAAAIAEGTTGTLYYRAKLADVTVSAGCSYAVGGYDSQDTGHASKTAVVGLNNTALGEGRAYTYSVVTGDIYIDPPFLDDWYEVWIYVDLTAAVPTGYFYEAYIAGPGFDGQVQMTASGGTVTQHALRSYNSPNGIAAFSVYKASSVNPSPGIFVDDLYVDLGSKNLSGPIDFLKAHNPTPADGAEQVELGATLEWYTGLADINDPDSWSSSGITHHHVYMSSGDPADPNLVYKTTIAAGAQTASWTPPTMSLDQFYYWRVNEGFNSNPSDPGVLTGRIWTFAVLNSMPNIVEQPASVIAAPGSNPQFNVVAINPLTGDTTDIFYQWYDATGGLPLSNGSDFNGVATDTLTVLDAQLGDEMYLYCRVTISTGSIDTDTVSLGIKNRLTSWSFNQADFSSGVHNDAETFQDAESFDPLATPTFVAGADGNPTGALLIETGTWCTAGAFDPTTYTGEMSISCWLKWNGTNGAFQSLVNKRNTSELLYTDFFYTGDLENANGAFKIDSNPAGNAVQANPGLTSGQWDHVVFTVADVDGVTKLAKIYINGLEKASGDFQFGPAPDAPVCIGARSLDGEYPFNGAIDDVAIYNYALTPIEVGTLYSAINGPFCVAYPPFDYDQSCVVDLGDFAIFAAQWLDCNIFPTCTTTIP